MFLASRNRCKWRRAACTCFFMCVCVVRPCHLVPSRHVFPHYRLFRGTYYARATLPQNTTPSTRATGPEAGLHAAVLRPDAGWCGPFAVPGHTARLHSPLHCVSLILISFSTDNQRAGKKCFDKCVTKPSSSLSSSEEVRHLSAGGRRDCPRGLPSLCFLCAMYRGHCLTLKHRPLSSSLFHPRLLNPLPMPAHPTPQACLAKCMDRFMEAVNVVSRAYVGKLQQQGH